MDVMLAESNNCESLIDLEKPFQAQWAEVSMPESGQAQSGHDSICAGALPDGAAAHLHAAALWGARSVLRHIQMVQDAAQIALDRYVDMVLRGTPPKKPAAWVRRVAANAARRLAGREARLSLLPMVDVEAPPADAAVASGAGQVDRAEMQRLVSDMAHHLTRRQCLVLAKMAEPEMTVARAARDLAMDRSGLRRVFLRGLARLRFVTAGLCNRAHG